jgi:deoxyribodipyrimidine photolyase
LIECLGDLKQNLKKKGLDLLVRHGRPEEILPSIAKAVSAHTVTLLYTIYLWTFSSIRFTSSRPFVVQNPEIILVFVTKDYPVFIENE